MKALRWHGREDVRIEEVPEPTLDGFADCLIEVTLCGICGSDIAEYRSGPAMIWPSPHPLSGREAPLTLGHELVGVLVEGNSVDGTIQPGDRVTIDACLRCEKCAACRRGDYHLCRYGGSVGLHSDGGFASQLAVPAYTLVAVPDAVSDLQASLTEPFAVALHALERGGLAAADDVLVFGFGPIGAATAIVARALGATPYVVETSAARRRRAEELGLRTIDAGEDLPRRARRMLGNGGPPVVVDSTGVPTVTPLAVECAGRGGRIVLVGLPNAPSEVDTRRLTLFERSLVGSLGYRYDLPRVLAMVAAADLDPAEVVGNVVPLEQAADELAKIASTPGGRIKTVIQVRESAGA